MEIKIEEPNKKQALFFKSEKKHTGFGGARGGGKSWAVRTKAKLLALRYNGIKILIVRRTYPELLNNHINFLRNELSGLARYNNTEKVFNFINKSTIKFMYCRNDSDLMSLQGCEYDVIFIDEATQLSEYQMKTITACCRGVNLFPKRIYYTCNPGGKGHNYIKRIFIDRHYISGENPEDYEFIQSLVDDNIALMKHQPDYVNTLEALPPKLLAAFRYGRWDVFEGQFFEEFVDDPEHYEDRIGTHVIEPFEIPSHWNIYRSYDFGYGKPFSTGYWTVDEDGILYRIAELYGCVKNSPNEGVKWTPDQQFEKMRELEDNHPYLKGKNIIGIADPSIWDKSRGVAIEETAAKHGIYFSPGDNKRIPGWMQCHYRLQFDENGIPGMYVFKNCKAFIRTVPLLTYSETNVEDLDTSQEDHVADEWRYMCMSRPIAARKTNEERKLEDDPLNMIEDVKRRTMIQRYI